MPRRYHSRGEWVERLERRRMLSTVAIAGVYTPPSGFFDSDATLLDFDTLPSGEPLAAETLVADQYASLGVRISVSGGGSSRFVKALGPPQADPVSGQNTLAAGHTDLFGNDSVTVVIDFIDSMFPALPDAVGLVFTDSAPNNPFTMRAYGADDALLDSATIDTADARWDSPDRTEDTFVGIKASLGISRIEYSTQFNSASGIFGIEADDLQFSPSASTLTGNWIIDGLDASGNPWFGQMTMEQSPNGMVSGEIDYDSPSHAQGQWGRAALGGSVSVQRGLVQLNEQVFTHGNISGLRMLSGSVDSACSRIDGGVLVAGSQNVGTWSAVRASPRESLFDSGDEGWTLHEDGTLSNPSSGGDPGGYLLAHDLGLGDSMYFVAPVKFSGDWRAPAGTQGMISVDYQMFGYGGYQYAGIGYSISGPGGSASVELPFSAGPSDADWQTVLVPLDQNDWTVTSGTWDQLLANVTEFRVNAEFMTYASEDNGFDNIRVLTPMENTTPPFRLSFPLAGMDPYTVPIVSVFDHAIDKTGEVVTYTGERGTKVDIRESTLDPASQSFFKDDGTVFELQGNYQGTLGTGSATMNYDGHRGYDYAVPTGTSVYAAADGVLHYGRADYGEIYVDHQNGYSTWYLHLKRFDLVPDGQAVSRGQKIGESGSTSPVSVSPHLHFGVHLGQVPVDPYGWYGSGADPYTAAANTGLWAFMYAPASGIISGVVFEDTDGDQFRDRGEPTRARQSVYIDANRNGRWDRGERLAMTDANGRYAFHYLPGGVHAVRLGTVPKAWLALSYTYANLPTGGSGSADLAMGRAASVKGILFVDANRNGRMDRGESTLAGWRIFLDVNKDGSRQAGEPSVLSGSRGEWGLGSLAPGLRSIRLVLPKGWRVTWPGVGYQLVRLRSGESIATARFGVAKPR